MNPSPSHPEEDRRQFKAELKDGKLRDVCALIESGSALEAEDSTGQEIPPMPEGMREQFIEQYGDTGAPASAPTSHPEPVAVAEGAGFLRSLLDWIGGRGLAFGGVAAAAAALVILFAVTNPQPHDPSTDLFRGKLGQTGMAERILFYNVTPSVTDRLVADYLEPEVTTRAADAGQVQAFLDAHPESVRIVVNGVDESLQRYEPGEQQASRSEPFAGLSTIADTDPDKVDQLFEAIVSLLEP